MSFLDVIGAAIPGAVDYAGARKAAAQQGADRDEGRFLKLLQLSRQQQQDALDEQVKRAHVADYQSLTTHRAAQDQAAAAGKPFYDSDRGIMVYPHGGALSPTSEGPPAQGNPVPGPRVADLGLPPKIKPRNIDPNSAEGIAAANKKAEGAAKAAATYGVEQVADPNDPTRSTFTQRINAPGQGAKQTLKVESAMNTAAQARLEAAVSEMNNAHSNMSDYETKLANGTAKISAPAQLLQRMANAFTHDDPLSQMTQSGALAALNRTDPDLARYIRRGLSFAEGESMISQRPSDFRTKMAAFLSTAASGATPEIVGDIQSRRNAILNPLNNVVGRKPSGGRGGHLASSREQQLWDAAVAKHGKAKVEAEYGPRPE